MTHPKLRKTIISLTIAGWIYIVIGLLFLALTIMLYNEKDTMLIASFGFMVILAFSLGIFNFVVNNQLRQKKRWAWIAAVILSCLYATSIFLPLGIIALFGLFDQDVQKDYK